MKIISLVPSITETLFDFGLNETQVIGRTKFCIHPDELVKKVEIIGGTKNLNIEKIRALKPDLIIANKEENLKNQVEELMEDHEVWLTNIETLEDNASFLTDLGNLLDQREKSTWFNEQIGAIFEGNRVSKPIEICYLIWRNPYMTVGGDTFISHILEKLGLMNRSKNEKRYPEISVSNMQEADCILLSSEPFPFRQVHIDELQAQLPTHRMMMVDGESFSWYGTHLVKCDAYFREFIAQF